MEKAMRQPVRLLRSSYSSVSSGIKRQIGDVDNGVERIEQQKDDAIVEGQRGLALEAAAHKT